MNSEHLYTNLKVISYLKTGFKVGVKIIDTQMETRLRFEMAKSNNTHFRLNSPPPYSQLEVLTLNKF